MTGEQGGVKLSVVLPVAVHRALKAAAALRGRTVQDVVQSAVNSWLKKYGDVPQKSP